MKVLRWKEHSRGYLIGFADVEMDEGYIVRGVTVHQKDDSKWCNPPARHYEKEDGSKGWSRTFDFATKNLYYDWSGAVLEALDLYLKQDATSTDDGVFF